MSEVFKGSKAASNEPDKKEEVKKEEKKVEDNPVEIESDFRSVLQ
jgi:hypothetical protein